MENLDTQGSHIFTLNKPSEVVAKNTERVFTSLYKQVVYVYVLRETINYSKDS